MKLQLEKEIKLRCQLEKQLYTVANANEKEREEMRRRSFECKVMSEEGMLSLSLLFYPLFIIIFHFSNDRRRHCMV